MFEKRIEIRWRDVDGLGHVNNAVYLTYLEEVRDEWLRTVLRAERDWSYALVHVSLDFRRELLLADDYVVGSCRALALGNSSIRTREELRTPAGELAAEAEVVIVARDEATGRSRPLTDDERALLEIDVSPSSR